MNKDNCLWVIEEYYDGEWHNTSLVAYTREECRTKRILDYYTKNTRIRKYVRAES